MTGREGEEKGGDLRSRFLARVGQTSPFPYLLEVERASGCWIEDVEGKRYLDFLAGISVCNVGHCHPRVVEAVQRQVELYAHTMVYGEHVQRPQVELAEEIARVAPEGMDCTYFLTTGAEANDAALKMCAKLTGRKKLVAFRRAYHGDTFGASAVFGDAKFRGPFAHILHPTVEFLAHGSFDELERIDSATAGVLVEPVQAEGGIRLPPHGWLEAVRDRCREVGALLVFDEVQTGFGRVGAWFAAGLYGVTPDAITMAKGMGMGMPLAGVLAPRDMLWRFAADPPFSHITTGGGHPVSCAAALAGMRVVQDEGLLANANARGEQLRRGVESWQDEAGIAGLIREVRGVGLWVGIETPADGIARQVVEGARERGLLVETNLLAENVVRLSPPLMVSERECGEALEILRGEFRRVAAAGTR